MEYFVWYGIYLILKELNMLPEHVPRGTIHDTKCGSRPTLKRLKERVIRFCVCDFDTKTNKQRFRNTIDEIWYGIESLDNDKRRITVKLHCKYCSQTVVHTGIYIESNNNNCRVDTLETAITNARNQLKGRN